MIFTKGRLDGVWLLDLEKRGDDRGFFARVFCAAEFAAHGMETTFPQMNTNYSATKGILKGLHWQTGAHAEAKLVRCIAGRAYEMLVDMRPDSPSFRQWEAHILTSAERKLLYLPPGFAHGFLSLEDHTEITYMVSQPYAPGAERGVRFDDPGLGLEWPIEIASVSEKDRNWPDFVG
jgi:dTDP-4-dehydrorhamnose 3,5-epimerase